MVSGQAKKILDQHVVCVELTSRCNNACRHCYNYWREDGHSYSVRKRSHLSWKDILRLLKRIMDDTPLEFVALSGGEPLLRSDLPLIVSGIVELGLQPIIITNGVLITDSLLSMLPKGITFEITLLGHTAELHNYLAGASVFDRVIRNMARIERHKSHLAMVFVSMKPNALAVYQTVELGIALGAGAVMYNRINISRGMKYFTHELVPSVDSLKESLYHLQEAVQKYHISSVCSVPIPPCIVDHSKYPDLHFGFCPRGGENSYYTIGCTGELRPCNHSSVVLGDLAMEGFAEIVTRPESEAYWKVIPKECINCEHPQKEDCKGGCTAAAHEYYGSQDRIDPMFELSAAAS